MANSKKIFCSILFSLFIFFVPKEYVSASQIQQAEILYEKAVYTYSIEDYNNAYNYVISLPENNEKQLLLKKLSTLNDSITQLNNIKENFKKELDLFYISFTYSPDIILSTHILEKLNQHLIGIFPKHIKTKTEEELTVFYYERLLDSLISMINSGDFTYTQVSLFQLAYNKLHLYGANTPEHDFYNAQIIFNTKNHQSYMAYQNEILLNLDLNNSNSIKDYEQKFVSKNNELSYYSYHNYPYTILPYLYSHYLSELEVEEPKNKELQQKFKTINMNNFKDFNFLQSLKSDIYSVKDKYYKNILNNLLDQSLSSYIEFKISEYSLLKKEDISIHQDILHLINFISDKNTKNTLTKKLNSVNFEEEKPAIVIKEKILDKEIKETSFKYNLILLNSYSDLTKENLDEIEKLEKKLYELLNNEILETKEHIIWNDKIIYKDKYVNIYKNVKGPVSKKYLFKENLSLFANNKNKVNYIPFVPSNSEHFSNKKIENNDASKNLFSLFPLIVLFILSLLIIFKYKEYNKNIKKHKILENEKIKKED